jgi:electron transfer flavoprotein alpha subunit
MSGILVFAETIEGRVADSAAQLVTAATQLGGNITLGLVAADTTAASQQASFSGVGKVLAVRAASDLYDHKFNAAALRAMIENVKPEAVLMAWSIRSAAFAAGVAEEADLGYASDVIALDRGESGALTAIRPVYGGKVHAELEFSKDAPALLLLRQDVWAPAASGATPEVKEVAAPEPAAERIRHKEFRRPEGGVDLTRSDIIFAVGRGVGEPEKIETFAEIARRAGAGLGASRPVVDAGWLPAPHQIGQTGVTVKPRLYVAFGISGAMQHLAGMQSSAKIVAVNTDPDAAIFEVAHIGAVADIHEVAEELMARLQDAGRPA